MVPLPDTTRAVDGGVVIDPATRAEFDPGPDPRVGADFDVGPQLRRGIDDRRGMNVLRHTSLNFF